MKKIALDQLAPGMKLARTVLTPDGRVMVAPGTELTQSLIARLIERGLPCAYIESELSANYEDIVSEKTISVLIQSVYALEQELRVRKELAWDKCKEPLFALVDEILGRRKKLFCATDIRVNEGYIYGHSVNVALLSILMGTTFGFNSLKLKELAVGALLHDVGMFVMPPEILHKRGLLSHAETKMVHDHPSLGFQLLRGRSDISAVAANVAYQHHEKMDGSGYPRQMAKDKILDLAQIVGVADVYDAMTSERVYRQALSPNQAINYLRSNAGVLFDPTVVAALIKNVAEFHIGTFVQLNNGQIAEVLQINHGDGRRPVVGLSNGDVIDLMQSSNLYIVDDLQNGGQMEEIL